MMIMMLDLSKTISEAVQDTASGTNFGASFRPYLWHNVALNRNTDFVQIFGWMGDECPNSIFFRLQELSKTSETRKLIFWLQVNTD